jgi:hypothetical protein
MARFKMLAVAGLVLVALACGSDPGPGAEPVTPVDVAPAATLSPSETLAAPSTVVPVAGSDPTVTPEPRPAVVYDGKDYTWIVNDDVLIKLPLREDYLQYSAAMHVEYVSSEYVFLDRFGRPTHAEIIEPNAKAALCAVLYNESVIAEAIARFSEIRAVPEIERPPLERHPCEPPLDPPAWTQEPWPDGYTMFVNDEVEIRFPYPCANCDPGSPLFLWHIETTADMTVDVKGRVNRVRRATPDALAAMCAVLADEKVMARAQAQAAETFDFSRMPPSYMIPNPCERLDTPISLEPFTTMTLEELGDFEQQRWIDGDEARPPEYKRVVNKDIEVRYVYPVPNRVWSSPITIWHYETSTFVHVDLGGEVVWMDYSIGPEAVEAICAVLNDEQLMAEVTARAAETGSYWRYKAPLSPDPCEGVE